MPLATEKISLQLTTKCNLACAHCSISCRPGKGRTFNRGMIRGVLGAASARGARFLTVTGGEPLEEETVLRSVLEEASKYQIRTSVVTNASWAGESQRLESVLDMFCELGVSSIDVSYDYYHSKFVNFAIIEKLIEVAGLRNVPVRILCGLTRHPRAFDIFRFVSSLPVDVIYYPIQALGRASNTRRDSLITEWFDDGVCPQAGQPFILADGRVLFCCGMSAFCDTPSFEKSAAVMGDLTSRPFDDIASSMLPVHDAVMSYPIPMLIERTGLDKVITESESGRAVCAMCYALLTMPDIILGKMDDMRSGSHPIKCHNGHGKHSRLETSPSPHTFGNHVKLRGPAVLAANALLSWDDLNGKTGKEMHLLGFVGQDGRISYRFVGPSISTLVRKLQEEGALLLEDPFERCDSQRGFDAAEFFRRASIFIAYEQGILSAVDE